MKPGKGCMAIKLFLTRMGHLALREGEGEGRVRVDIGPLTFGQRNPSPESSPLLQGER
jgi:hypothetical protein